MKKKYIKPGVNITSVDVKTKFMDGSPLNATGNSASTTGDTYDTATKSRSGQDEASWNALW